MDTLRLEGPGGRGNTEAQLQAVKGEGGAQDPEAGTRLRPEGRGLLAERGWVPSSSPHPHPSVRGGRAPRSRASRDLRWIAEHRAQRTVLPQVGAAAGFPSVWNLEEPRPGVVLSVESRLASSPAPVPAAGALDRRGA